MIEPTAYAFVAIAFLLAGFVKGVIGLGLPTVSMGLLALVLAPSKAAALLVVPSLVTNLWQLAAGPSLGALVRRLGPMLACVCLGTWATAGLLANNASGLASAGLGLSLVAYSGLGLFARPLSVPAAWEIWLSPLAGAVTGLITGVTGTFVIPIVPYLQALGLDRNHLIQALGLSFTVSTAALAVALWQLGAFDVSVGTASLLAVAPAAAGMAAGQWLRGRISTDAFRRWFLIGMLLVGMHLVLRGLG